MPGKKRYPSQKQQFKQFLAFQKCCFITRCICLSNYLLCSTLVNQFVISRQGEPEGTPAPAAPGSSRMLCVCSRASMVGLLPLGATAVPHFTLSHSTAKMCMVPACREDKASIFNTLLTAKAKIYSQCWKMGYFLSPPALPLSVSLTHSTFLAVLQSQPSTSKIKSRHSGIPYSAPTAWNKSSMSLVQLLLMSVTATSAICITKATLGTEIPKEAWSVSPIQTWKITLFYFNSMRLNLPRDLELSI